jgi:hypothetical protein
MPPNEMIYQLRQANEKHARRLGLRFGLMLRVTLLSLQLPVVVPAQQKPPAVERVPDAVSCAACRIVTSPPINLRVPPEHALSMAPQVVRADSQGRIWLLTEAAVLVFDRRGNFLQSVGREGGGPNEYRGPGAFYALPGDSVLIIDPENARASVLSPKIRYVRSISFPYSFARGAILRWPDSVLLSGAAPGARASAEHLHLVSFRQGTARTLTSVAVQGGSLRSGAPRNTRQHVEFSSDGSLVSVDRYSYDLTLWSSVGVPSRRLQRRPQWFAEGSKATMGSPKSPPPPIIGSTWADSAGSVWIASNVAAPGWSTAWSGVPAGGDIRVSSIAMERLYNTKLEIIDTKTARVTARLELDGWIISILPGGRLVKYSVDVRGEPQVSVIDARLSPLEPS